MGGYKNSITDIDGKVGINNSNPIYALDISGDSTSGVVAIRNSANGNDTLRSENASGIRTFNVANDGSGHGILLVRNSSGTTTNYISGSGNSYFNGGNVGIGTSSPDASFSVNGTIRATTSNYASPSTGGAISVFQDNNDYATIWAVKDYNLGWADVTLCRLGGNVGIGTSSPNYPLTTYSSTSGSQFIASFGKGLASNEYVAIGLSGFVASNGATKAGIALKRTNVYGTGELHFLNNNTLDNSDATLSDSKMVIDSSGRVGIGISSITANANADDLQIGDGTGGNRGLTITAQNNSGAAIYFGDGDDTDIGSIRYDNSNNSMKFFTNTTEAMRILSGGTILIGTTTGGGVGGLTITPNNSNGAASLFFNRNSTTGNSFVQDFLNGGTSVGYIAYNNTSVTYSTSSDYRLKENVVAMTGALDRVDALKPSRFNFIADPNKTVDGFLAHEVAEVVPEAISGEKDAMEEYEVTPAEYETVIIQEAVEATYDEEGNELTPAQEAITEQRLVSEAVMGTRPVYQGIDQSKLVPLLVGAIQELRAEIEALKQNSVS